MEKDLIPSGDREITQDKAYQALLEDLRSILSKGEQKREKATEDFKEKIAAEIEVFLKEGKGDFSFVGRQVSIKTGDETQFIDLVLHHARLACYVLVKLNIERFGSGDVGQMNAIVSYYRQNEHKNAIGLILCREAGREEVRYSLGGLENDIFVIEYGNESSGEELKG